MSDSGDGGGDTDSGTAVALTGAARQQVIEIAAEVLGRMDDEQIPGPLRKVAKFTPGKRRRLGATALAAALDTDAGFRARVAGAVEQASGGLADALRSGASTAAADPVDVMVLAYLMRPDGWQRLMARAHERQAAEALSRRDAEQQADVLRAQLRETRAQHKRERAELREQVASAGARAGKEIAERDRTLRKRTGELRAAERERDRALAEAVEARATLDRERGTSEAELRRARARIAELEQALEAARRDVRAGRDLDDARLWLLVDTLVRAASGLRKELSLPPPSTRPGDVVAAADAGPAGARTATPDAAGFERLLALPDVHVIVDGYNVTKTGYPELPLADQRLRLIKSLAALRARAGAEITAVFDGAARPPVLPRSPRGVRVLFSAADEIADDMIRRLVAAEPSGRVVIVVTADQEVVRDVRTAGAWAVPSAVLLERLG